MLRSSGGLTASANLLVAVPHMSLRSYSSSSTELNKTDDGKSTQTFQTTVRTRVASVVKSVRSTLARHTSSGNDVVSSDDSAKYKAPTPPTGVPLSKVLSNIFPLPVSDSYSQWLERHDLQKAEEGVLKYVPFFPESDGIREAQSLAVPVGSGNYVNEFEITRKNEDVKEHLVVLHGYGAGLGFFYKNFEAMSSISGWKVHALDLLGYGRSSRPKFRISARDRVSGVLEAEKFFHDALETWRQERGIEKFTLVAHSLGAYIGSSYAAKHKDRVKKMMLVSPAGVPRSIYSIPANETNGEESPIPPGGAVNIPGWFKYLWEKDVSPFSLVRNTGPLGPRFVSAWTSRRFANLPEDEADALHRYVYGIFNARGSGEYALNYLLAPGAHGRWPLAERAESIPCPTLWVYGDRDWMDIKGGIEACQRLTRKGLDARVVQVPHSGHHIYLDNPTDFNWLTKKFMMEP